MMASFSVQCFLSLLGVLALLVGSSFAWVSPSVSSFATAKASNTARYLSSESPDGVHKGTVKWFDTVKGFGFIVPADGSNDVFVHQSAIKMEGFRSLADGEEVEYMIDLDPKTGKRKAVQVTGPDGADVKGAPFRPANDYNNY